MRREKLYGYHSQILVITKLWTTIFDTCIIAFLKPTLIFIKTSLNMKPQFLTKYFIDIIASIRTK